LRICPTDRGDRQGLRDYQAPFAFTGTIEKLTFNLGPVRMSEVDQQRLQQAQMEASAAQ
jgi:hypothetical protein